MHFSQGDAYLQHKRLAASLICSEKKKRYKFRWHPWHGLWVEGRKEIWGWFERIEFLFVKWFFFKFLIEGDWIWRAPPAPNRSDWGWTCPNCWLDSCRDLNQPKLQARLVEKEADNISTRTEEITELCKTSHLLNKLWEVFTFFDFLHW